MEIFSAFGKEMIVGIIGAIIGSIFGASGLLFFPLKKYMENKFEKAEKEALDRVEYQKKISVLRSEELASTDRYLFWIKELLHYLLSRNHCQLDNTEYWKKHLSECADELKSIQAKRKALEREQLVEIDFDSK